jgi:large subunit ribosomal protein L7Ae
MAPKAATKKVETKKVTKTGKDKTASSIFVSRPKNFAIGGNVQHKRDLTQFLKWPKYVRLQRQKSLLMTRLKVPPMINQFSKTLEKKNDQELFKMLNKYRPETVKEKKERLAKLAETKAKTGETSESKKPYFVKSGLNHITHLIEQKKAQLVVIAHDVDPIELVVWLPTLCRRMDVPYCIVKSKARLGQVVHLKTATALAFTDVKQEDKANFANIVSLCKAQFNDKYEEVRKQWGGVHSHKY